MRDDSQLYGLYDEVDQDARPGKLGAAIAATVSLAVLALVVVWAYRLGVRDAAEVPVIRAVEGPMRVRPEEPGGAQFEHQGRAVYDALGGASQPEPEVATAPPPERLAPEDLSVDERTAPPPPPPVEAAVEVDQLVAAVLGEEAAAAPQAPAAATGLMPTPRPVAGAPRPAAPAAATISAVPTAPVEVAALGGAEIQLGAYLSEADALRMWGVILQRNGDLLGGREPIVAPLQGDTRTLHRLRAGPFASVAEAREFCAALQARGEDCLVSGPR
jgi:hypothetical protein